MIGFPKPKRGGRKREKRRERRQEVGVIDLVREHCVRRDGHCRLKKDRPHSHACEGPSEWAHLKGHRRSLTRGQEPERRHMAEFTMMLCQRAHQWEEHGLLEIAFARPEHGAEGLTLYTLKPELCHFRV